MAGLAYPPHITLAIYPCIGEDQLRDVLRQVFSDQGPILLRFHRLCYFERPNLVFWVAPELCKPLMRVHAAIHKLIDPASCEVHYRPDNWVPHCTLATHVTAPNREEAITLANEPIEAFDVTFDWADCVRFPPVRVIEEFGLSPTVFPATS
jgi:2'-5' RNA ligase